VKVTMMLADAAQAVDGKLYILGGGWSIIGPQPAPLSIALLIEVPWDQTNMPHRWTLELLDSDGHPITAEDPDGEQQPIRLDGELEVGRPAGLTPGTPIGVPLAINLGPLALPPGERYVWMLTVDDERREDWRLPFSTRSPTTD
jgi:Family of unknown function (DUF6941)